MKNNGSAVLADFLCLKKYVPLAVAFIILAIFAGCATAPPQPITIKHGKTPSMSQTAIPKQKELIEPADESITALVALLKEKNLISQEESARIIEKSETQATKEKKQVKEAVKREIREEVPKEIEKAAAPEWTKRIKFRGDIRLRYEKDFYDKNNADFAKPEKPNELMNTKVDQDRFKYRIRFGADVHVTDNLDAVILLSTGNINTPVSTNTILGDYLNKDNIVIDQAYLRWRPRDFLTISGGRIPNPWFSASTLVWDDDLNFEGFALQVRTPIMASLMPFFTVGAFPLDSYEFSKHDKWLTGAQIGIERESEKGFSAKIGASYYSFSNITGELNDPLSPGDTDWTAPQYQQKGNTLFNISADPAIVKTALAAEFQEVALSGKIDVGFWDPYHIVLFGDYVKNLAFDKSDVAERTGNPDQPEDTVGYQLGLSIGHPKMDRFGAWRTYLQYKHIEADAVVDAFTDSDFHLGGTNAKGWILGAEFGLSKNVWFVLKWLTADEISGPPLSIDVLFMDINARF